MTRKPDVATPSGNAANGCETNIGTSNAHCGLCGSVCPAGTTCVMGRCTPTAPFAGYAVTTPPPGVMWIDACAAPGRVTALGAARWASATRSSPATPA